MAFLSSRKQETESKLFSAAGTRIEFGGLTNVETGGVSGLENKFVWIRRQFETAYQLVLQSRHSPRLKFHPCPSHTKQFQLSLLYSTAEEGYCDLAEIFIFVSSLYVLATLTRGLDNALVSLR